MGGGFDLVTFKVILVFTFVLFCLHLLDVIVMSIADTARSVCCE